MMLLYAPRFDASFSVLLYMQANYIGMIKIVIEKIINNASRIPINNVEKCSKRIWLVLVRLQIILFEHIPHCNAVFLTHTDLPE